MSHGRCRICGCTETHPCVSGEIGNCSWVDSKQDLCSHCLIIDSSISIERPVPRPLTKEERQAAFKKNHLIIRPQYNHPRKGWMIVMYNGKGWTTRFSSEVHETRELALAGARKFALEHEWYTIID